MREVRIGNDMVVGAMLVWWGRNLIARLSAFWWWCDLFIDVSLIQAGSARNILINDQADTNALMREI